MDSIMNKSWLESRLRIPTEGRRGLVAILITLTFCGFLWRCFLSYYFVPTWETANKVAQFPDDYPALARSMIDTGTFGYAPERGGGGQVRRRFAALDSRSGYPLGSS